MLALASAIRLILSILSSFFILLQPKTGEDILTGLTMNRIEECGRGPLLGSAVCLHGIR